MVKHQQMQWTQRGAHLLLQIRTHVLNEECEEILFGAGIQASGHEPRNSRLRRLPNPRNRMLSPLLREKTQAAPKEDPPMKLSPGPPTTAVFPSADSATAQPCSAVPVAPAPISLLPCWVPAPPVHTLFSDPQ
jgi:hypothetical protein